MSLLNEFLYIGFAVLGYVIPFISFLISILAVHYKSILNGSTKYIVVMCLLSLAYLSMHHGYMTSDMKLPLDSEFEWRGFHLIVFAVFYAVCLDAISYAKPLVLNLRKAK